MRLLRSGRTFVLSSVSLLLLGIGACDPNLLGFASTQTSISGVIEGCSLTSDDPCADVVRIVPLGEGPDATPVQPDIALPPGETSWTFSGLAPDTAYTLYAIRDVAGETDPVSLPFVYATTYGPPIDPDPQAPGSAVGHVGTTPGTASVTNGGRFTYSIPIEVPPGTRGLSPALRLRYRSDSRNGLTGVGLRLDGLSVIMRCGKNLHEDGERAGVTYTSADRFCLDGVPLVAVTGQYGAAGTVYRTRRERFAKIVSYGSLGSGPEWFEVWSRSGQILEYGSTLDARIPAPGRAEPSGWALKRVSDRQGSYLSVDYLRDDAAGRFRPERIDYTGNDTAVPPLAPYNAVVFVYADRQDAQGRYDIPRRYRGGSPFEVRDRLERIEVHADQALVREYRIAYEQGVTTRRWRADSIQECDGAGVCVPATDFTWADAEGARQTVVSPTGWTFLQNDVGYQLNALPSFTGDIDGNGHRDVIAMTQDGQTPPSYFLSTARWDPAAGDYVLQSWPMPVGDEFSAIRVGDVDADGLDDVLVLEPTILTETTADSKVHALLSTGDGAFTFDPSKDVTLPLVFFVDRQWMAGDLDGDGRADFVRVELTATGTLIHTGLSTGDGGFTVASDDRTDPWCAKHRWLTGDANQDGRFDLICLLENPNVAGQLRVQILLSNGDGTFQDTIATSLGFGFTPDEAWRSADLNGDGSVDLVGLRPNGSDFTVHTAISRGDGTFVERTAAESPPELPEARWYLTDADADGIADLVVHGAVTPGSPHPTTELWIGVGDGEGEFDFPATPLSLEVANADSSSAGFGFFGGTDMDGDGLSDFVSVVPDGPTGLHAITTSFAPGAHPPDRVERVVNGLGAEWNVVYEPLPDGPYVKDAGAVYPAVDVQPALAVVTSVDSSDGLGGLRRMTYEYEGLRLHATLGRPVGFRLRREIDEARGTHVETTFIQDPPLEGAVEKTELWRTSPSRLLERTTSTWIARQLDVGLPGERTFREEAVRRTEVFEPSEPARQPPVRILEITQHLNDLGSPEWIRDWASAGLGFAWHERKRTFAYEQDDVFGWFVGRPTRVDELARSFSAEGGQTETRANTFLYDPSAGLLLREERDPEVQALRQTIDYTHDDFGNVTSASVSVHGANPPPPRTTLTQYDARGGQVAWTENAVGHRTWLSFDGRGLLSERRTPKWLGVDCEASPGDCLIVEWEYDGLGRQTLEIRPDGTRTVTKYTRCDAGCTPAEAAGAPLVITSQASGAAPAIAYLDVLGREVLRETEGFAGERSFIRQGFDAVGRRRSSSRPYFEGSPVFETVFSYDVLGRPVQADTPDGTTTVTYGTTLHPTTGGAVLEVTTTDPKSQVARELLDGRDWTVGAYDDNGRFTNMRRDPWGNLVAATDPLGNATTWDYDVRGNLLATSHPDQGNGANVYDGFDELVSVTDAKGQTTTFEYDAIGRLTKRVAPEGESHWSYDAKFGLGRIRGASGPGGYSRAHAYDDLGREVMVAVQVGSDVFTTGRTYDAYGRIDRISYPTGFAVRNLYTDRGDFEKAVEEETGALLWRVVDLDADGQVALIEHGNGLWTTRSYDDATGRLDSVNSSSASGYAQNEHYGYDNVGNLEWRNNTRTNVQETFGYDNLNRITSADATIGGTPQPTVSYDYDPIGNLTLKSDVGTLGYDGSNGGGPHAVTALGPRFFSYDANGDMSCWMGLHNGYNNDCTSGRIFAYTSFGQPSTITTELGLGPESEFLYDTEHARVKQVARDTASGPETTTIYIGDLYERVTAGPAVDHLHYIHAAGEIAAVRIEEEGGPTHTRHLHRDYLGSIEAVTDEAGAVIERLSYDAFGARRAPGTLDPELRRGYTNHEHLDHLAWIHMNARIYDPVLGRVLQSDPVLSDPRDGESYNGYSYARNNPLRFTDPTGREAVTPPNLPDCAFCPNVDAGLEMLYAWSGWSPSFGGVTFFTVTATVEWTFTRAGDATPGGGVAWGPWTPAGGRIVSSGVTASGGSVGGSAGSSQEGSSHFTMELNGQPWTLPIEHGFAVPTKEIDSGVGPDGIPYYTYTPDIPDGATHWDPYEGWVYGSMSTLAPWEIFGIGRAGLGALRGLAGWIRTGREFGRNFRIAPFGNRTGHPTGRFPHYHRRVPHPTKPGEGAPGQGIRRHRPWDTKGTDRSFWDRF